MRTTKLYDYTLCSDGSVGITLMKRVADDFSTWEEPHRVVVQPDETFAQVIAEHNITDSLASIGFPPVPEDDVARVDQITTAHRAFPDIAAQVEVYKTRRAAAEAAANAAQEAKAARLEAERLAGEQAQAELEAQQQAAAEARMKEISDLIEAEVAKRLAR